ncbi:MarR family transcriptional regulator [Fusibacter sp. Q10-2]|uniref:MarR family transcriptional regulator n=2 Tax=Fusibacter ferrireducens TaxID=2785058 RepID=A0ABR9ZQG6_9FIRM|nr:MarR family transcriptional regulator [Fusibacter ferrireducens]
MEKLKEIQNLLEKGLKSFYSEYELTVPQLTVVTLLERYGALKITDISTEMKISPAAVSGIIDRLEKQDLVKRVRSDIDKRKVFVSLTEHFCDAHQNMDQNLSRYLQLLLASKDAPDVQKIIEGLTLLETLLNSDDQILANYNGEHI